MLEFDECDQILVTNPFADDAFTVSSNDNHDAFVTLTLGNSSSEHHPLRSRSVSPARHYSTPSIPSVTVIGSEGETQPWLTSMLSLDRLSAEVAAEEDRPATSEVPRSGSDTIIHPVGPNDSFAGVALRYGTSIAALRRANQLWPSDPIHLRTELFIPRGDTPRAKHKTTRSASAETALRSTFEPTLNLSPDLVASPFVAARNMIISAARISMESLSSKASASEDHELDDFQKARAQKIPATETPFAEAGYELSSLAAPRAQYTCSGAPLSSQVPYSPTNRHLDDNHNHIPPTDNLHSRSSSSPSVSLEQLSRARPFVVLPVRTSQLEPEPAMELPVRCPRI